MTFSPVQRVARRAPGGLRAVGVLAVGMLLAIAAAAAPADGAPPRVTSGDETLDNAVAAVVVAALGEQFAGSEPISMRLATIQVSEAGGRGRVVSGEGHMRLGEDLEWIGFRYRTLYDPTFANAGYPELTLGGVDAGDREIPNDALLVRQLDDRIIAALDRAEGSGARLQLDRIATIEAGRRFLRITASGVADFGLRGITPIRIESLYDITRSTWQRVHYELGVPGETP